MSSQNTKALEFNQYGKCDKTPSIIFENLESLIKKLDVKIIPRSCLKQK